jgi:cell shape-determining protein MreC
MLLLMGMGLVGRITKVSKYTSVVLLITDKEWGGRCFGAVYRTRGLLKGISSNGDEMSWCIFLMIQN